MSTKRFRIAFSFAGEKRDFVEKTAAVLALQFGREKILYDKYHESEFARRNLGIYLPTLYNEESELIVVVICQHYDQKEWTGLEWMGIHDLLQQRRDNEVLLCRFDRAHVSGLFRGAGYIDLDHKEPEEYATLILERLAINEGKPKDYYTKATSPTVSAATPPRLSIPHNLPTLQPFFGRTEELRKIADALDPESRTWGALIDGPGGMGKTSLAVHAAYNTPTGAFEKIAFISLKLRELDDDGLRDLSGYLISGLAELFNELARELGHADIAKAVEDQRPRLLLDALRGTRTLLILDNLESLTKPERDAVFNFVKRLPPGCKAILTSRGRIGSAAEELILEKLDEQAALDTLAKLAENNAMLARATPQERRELYLETGGKPLLLRWTAGQIGRGSCRTIRDAIDYLRSCPADNDALEFIFGDLVADFSEAETRALCALSYFTLPARVEHIVAVAECTDADTNAALRSLANRSLAVPSEELDTYTLVPLVADYLRKKKPEVMAETGDRLQKQAYALAIENGYDNHDRFHILEAAWPALASALPRITAGTNAPLQELNKALKSFLNFTGRWDELLALNLDAERKAVEAGDFWNAGLGAYFVGWVYFLRGQSAEVLACAARAEANWQKGDAGVHEQATVISLRGNGRQLEKDYPAAIAAYQQSLGLYRSIDPESKDVASCLNDLASAEHLSGDYEAATRHCEEALQIARNINDAEGVAIYTGNLAALAVDKEDWPHAETQAMEALALSENVGRQELIALDCTRLARALLQQYRKEEALLYARRAVEIYTRLGLPDTANAQAILDECES